MLLLSVTGTLRTIALLTLAWLLIRLWMRARRGPAVPPGGRWAPPDDRSRGEVRIERSDRGAGPDVVDTEYEEVP